MIGTLLKKLLHRDGAGKGQPAGPEAKLKIVEALSVYLTGSPDSGHLRRLAAAHPDDVRDAILNYQSIVAGRREELCGLAIELGYVDLWSRQTHSGEIEERRKAFSYLSAVAGYEPVRRITGDIPARALQDPDEQIRVDAARILLSTKVPAAIARVFKGSLSDTPGVRLALAGELARYATELCRDAIPEILRSRDYLLNALQMLVSWERALPLTDLREVAECPDRAVRVEAMHLLQFLPPTPENRLAVLHGLNDKEEDVRVAAAIAAGRLRLADSPASGAPDDWLEGEPVGQNAGSSQDRGRSRQAL